MTFNGVIQRKLALLDTQIVNLKHYLRDIERENFIGDWGLRSMAERGLQVAIEIVIDIAERIIAIKKSGPVTTATDAIRKLVELDILDSEKPYIDMVRFRNMIVHEYESVDPHLLYELATERLADFEQFRDEIDRHV